jgi:pimeloyl-ACP methyl ester carboxylesterase
LTGSCEKNSSKEKQYYLNKRKIFMQTRKFITVYFLMLLFFASQVNAQKVIDYGSNNGKYLSIYGTKIYYEEYGSGTPLLLLHGGLSSINSFSNLIPDLSKHFRVIVTDAPGEGRSEEPDSISYKLLAAYASKMIDLLKLDSVYVYGFSLGGNTALQLAADRPDKVKMTVVHSAVYNYNGFGPGFGGDKVTPEMMEAHPQIWLNDHMKKTPQKDKWKQHVQAIAKMMSTRDIISEDRLRQIKTPVLIVQGDRDLITPEHALRMYNLIKGSQLCIIPATTHFVLFENPDLVKKPILDFLLKKGPVMKLGM